jgi:tetraacyldisaccharide 4'-kinase
LDIVLIDATCPWGHDYLLPRGLLREPIGGLKRADVVVLTHCDQAPTEVIENIRRRLRQRAPRLPVIETTHRPARWVNASRSVMELAALAGRPWAGFCGLGNPESFRRTLADLGGEVVAWRTFADHHDYTRGDIEDLERWASGLPDQTAIVTTQKDLVKIRLDRLAGRELWALAIRMDIASGEELLSEKLLSVLRGQAARNDNDCSHS